MCLFFSKPDMSRLRLAAGNAIVKLAQEPCYHEIITLEQYQLCALAINVRKLGGTCGLSANVWVYMLFVLNVVYTSANLILYKMFSLGMILFSHYIIPKTDFGWALDL